MAVTGVESTQTIQTTSTTASSNSNSLLSMDDFLSLMVAQLANQDMYNPVDNTEYIAQMAQFSMVQALSDLTQASMASYGVSLIGKEGTVAELDSNGYLNKTVGIIEGVNFYNGETEVIIDGNAYKLSSVMQIAEPKIIIPTDPKETEDNDDTTDDTDDDTVNGVNSTEEPGTSTEGGDDND